MQASASPIGSQVCLATPSLGGAGIELGIQAYQASTPPIEPHHQPSGHSMVLK